MWRSSSENERNLACEFRKAFERDIWNDQKVILPELVKRFQLMQHSRNSAVIQPQTEGSENRLLKRNQYGWEKAAIFGSKRLSPATYPTLNSRRLNTIMLAQEAEGPLRPRHACEPVRDGLSRQLRCRRYFPFSKLEHGKMHCFTLFLNFHSFSKMLFELSQFNITFDRQCRFHKAINHLQIHRSGVLSVRLSCTIARRR